MSFKKYFFILLALITPLFASAKKLEAYFYHCTFQNPSQGPFVETYLSVIGSSLQPRKTGAMKKGEVEITYIFKKKDEIAAFNKVVVPSPSVHDTAVIPNFIDQQRFALKDGSYDFELQIRDVNSTDSAFTYSEKVLISFSTDDLRFSDIQLLESYKPAETPGPLTKNGYDLVPYVSNFYPKSMNRLAFYAELYNSSKAFSAEEKFLVNYFLENYDTGQRLDQFFSFSRKSPQDVVVLLAEFPINSLLTGNYNLVVEARNKNNDVVAQRKFMFHRSMQEPVVADFSNIDIATTFVSQIPSDSLNEFLKCLRPIAGQTDYSTIKSLVRSNDDTLKRKFFYSFWKSRNPVNPEGEWANYYKQVQYVNSVYSTRIMKGYDTDRGRVYLKYGTPNSIQQRNQETSSYPYEIWHYYRIGNFSNKRFIFYNPDLVTNNYELLHSDLFGEVNNPNWQYNLNRRRGTVLGEQEKEKTPFGSESDDLFQTPR